MPAPREDDAIETLRRDRGCFDPDTKEIAKGLYEIVLRKIGGKIDQPISYAAILRLQLQLAPEVRKYAKGMDKSDADLLQRQLDAFEREARKRSMTAQRYSPADDREALRRSFLRFPNTRSIYERHGLTFAQLLAIEYGAIIRPMLSFWTL